MRSKKVICHTKYPISAKARNSICPSRTRGHLISNLKFTIVKLLPTRQIFSSKIIIIICPQKTKTRKPSSETSKKY